MGRWYDEDVCNRCNERIHHDTHHDIYDDIKPFIHKMKVLENKLDYVSEIFPVFSSHKRRNNGKFCAREEANVLIEKVRLLERKLNNFSKALPLENTANTDGYQTSSNKAFEDLIDKLKILEGKLGDFSKIVDPSKAGDSENDRAQIKEKLRAMEEKIEHFYEHIPNNFGTASVGKTRESPPIVIKQTRKLAGKIHKTHEDPTIIMEQMQEIADTSKIHKTHDDSPVINEQMQEIADTSKIRKTHENPFVIMKNMRKLADRTHKTHADPPVTKAQMQELPNTSNIHKTQKGHPDVMGKMQELANMITVHKMHKDSPVILEQMRELADMDRIHKTHKYPPVIMEQMRELADRINFYSKIISSTTMAELSMKKRKKSLPKPIFSGKILPKRKSSVKKGFITWPSEDDLSEVSNDRHCYVMRCGESHANIRTNLLISEPSEFYFDSNLESQTNGISIRESKACGTSKVKNSELMR